MRNVKGPLPLYSAFLQNLAQPDWQHLKLQQVAVSGYLTRNTHCVQRLLVGPFKDVRLICFGVLICKLNRSISGYNTVSPANWIQTLRITVKVGVTDQKL